MKLPIQSAPVERTITSASISSQNNVGASGQCFQKRESCPGGLPVIGLGSKNQNDCCANYQNGAWVENWSPNSTQADCISCTQSPQAPTSFITLDRGMTSLF
jgi:hypothetical protein